MKSVQQPGDAFVRALWTAILVLTPGSLSAQSAALSISSSSGIPGGSVTLAVNLTASGVTPSAIQWTLLYPANQISAIYVFAGPAATAAGKAILCAPRAGAYACLLAGPNATSVASGTIANVQLTLAPLATTTAVSLSNTLASDPSGRAIALSAAASAVVAVPMLAGVTCSPGTLAAGSAAVCTVALDSPASPSGVPVAMTSSDALLSIPSIVTIPAGAGGASFTATAQSPIASPREAVITAAFNGSLKTAGVSLLPGSPQTPPTPQLTIAPTALLFVNGANQTVSKTLSIASSIAGTSYTASASTATGAGWLSISPGAGSLETQSALTVSADSTGLPAGSYIGAINITAAGGAVASIAVTMAVGIPSQISAAPAVLNFTYDQTAGTAPSGQGIAVFTNPPGANFTASVSPDGIGWLQLSSASVTPGVVTASVTPGSLGAGTYSAKITIASAAGNVEIPAVLSITNSPPKLAVAEVSQEYAARQGSAALSGQIAVLNTGGGTLQFSAQLALGQGNWLSLAASSGSATAAAPASLGFTLNPAGLAPGLYSRQIILQNTDSGDTRTVAISFAVSDANRTVALSQAGLTFTAVEGGPPPPAQSLAAAFDGSAGAGWTVGSASFPDSGGLASAWMNATSSSAGTDGNASVAVTADPNGLPAGHYYGMLQLDDSGAANDPQSATVVLNVLPSNQPPPGIDIPQGGLIVTAAAGALNPQPRQLTLFNPTGAAITYSSTTFSNSGSGWLTLPVPGGTLLPGSNAVLTVVDFHSMTPGIHTGTIWFGFSDGAIRVVQVEAIALAAAGCPNGSPGVVRSVFQYPLDGSVLNTSIARPVRVLAVDDCGNTLSTSNGDAVEVIFANQDPPLKLRDTGKGIWEAVWVPRNAGAAVTLNAVAFKKSAPGIATIGQITTVVQQAAGVPAPSVSAVVNAASSSQATPQIAAPGSYVAVYGNGLTAGNTESAAVIPLPASLAGAQLFLGDKPMPLIYAGSGQVNALVPQGINLNVEQQLSVMQAGARSVPVPLLLTASYPGIFTLDASGSGQGIAQIVGTTLLAGPPTGFSRPVQRGSESLIVYCTGLGPVIGPNGEPPPPDGSAAPASLLYQTTARITATIGGVDAPVTFSGLTPTLVGLYQVNIQVPAGVSPGTAVPLLITATDPRTQMALQSNSVTIAVE